MTSDKARKSSQLFRVLLVLGWTALCGVIWFVWIGVTASTDTMQSEGSETALGCAACMVTGCTGGTWFLGLVVFLVVWLIVRR